MDKQLLIPLEAFAPRHNPSRLQFLLYFLLSTWLALINPQRDFRLPLLGAPPCYLGSLMKPKPCIFLLPGGWLTAVWKMFWLYMQSPYLKYKYGCRSGLFNHGRKKNHDHNYNSINCAALAWCWFHPDRKGSHRCVFEPSGGPQVAHMMFSELAKEARGSGAWWENAKCVDMQAKHKVEKQLHLEVKST